jgi:hypothetical protein
MIVNDVAKTYHIYFDQQVNAVVMKWKGYATSDQFKEGTEYMLRTLSSNNATKVLADIKDMVIIGMEDQHWLETNFLPRAIQAGFQAIAIIKPDYYFNKVAVESISYKISRDKLTINFFDNVSEAKEWLRKI